jgi:D-glycero-alpha-D-manno-heptose-7-phosphate kinase
MKIISSAPARISFLGGGSDLAEFSDQYGSAVLSMAINLRSHVELMTGDDMWNEYNVFPQSCSSKLCYKIRDAYQVNSMHHSVVKSSFDGIIGAGLGSSGAFSVALVTALEKLNDRTLDPYSVAEKAYKIELSTHKTGRQDHYASTYGGFNLFTFGDKSNSVPLSKNWVDLIYPYMVLTYVGKRKKSSHSLDTSLIKSMQAIIPKAIESLGDGKVLDFISFVNLSWQMKRELKASTPKIDKLYQKGLDNGALGGKLLGSGGGGYFLFFVEPMKRK